MHLDLSGTNIIDEYFDFFDNEYDNYKYSINEKLEILNLYNTKLTNKFIYYIRKKNWFKLRKLNIYLTKIDEDGIL